jgi:hypothetical protein
VITKSRLVSGQPNRAYGNIFCSEGVLAPISAPYISEIRYHDSCITHVFEASMARFVCLLEGLGYSCDLLWRYDYVVIRWLFIVVLVSFEAP